MRLKSILHTSMKMSYFQDSPSYRSLLNFSSLEFDNEEYITDGWTLEENKLFENVLGEFDPVGSLAFFEHVALLMPWKSIETIKLQYQTLVEDIEMIKSDLFETPMDDHESAKNEKGPSSSQATRSNPNHQKQKASPWNAQERKLFLMRLEKFGKGDWRSIARYFVTPKTPTQVASHAQKVFGRRTSTTPADNRRPSINDIQTINSTSSSYPQRLGNPPQQPNTAQNNRVAVPNNFCPNDVAVPNNFRPNDDQVAGPFPNPMCNITGNNNTTTTTTNYNYNVQGQIGSAVYPSVNSTFQVDNNGNPMINQAWMNQQFWSYLK